jgi:RimK family alpha-L-glutamate ligase
MIQMVCINPRRCDLQLSTLRPSKSASSSTGGQDDTSLPLVPGAASIMSGSSDSKSGGGGGGGRRHDIRYEGFHIMYEGERVRMPDACVPLIGAVIDYAGLACMRQLEAAGVRMINSPAGIDISRDKFVCHQTLAMAGLPTPRSMMLRRPPDVHLVKRQLGFPCIVKLPSGSKGDAVWKADTPEELQVLCERLKNKPLFVQEFIASTKGRDLRLFTAGDRVVAAMMRVARKGFKANVHQVH